jgi:hypothetical protein
MKLLIAILASSLSTTAVYAAGPGNGGPSGGLGKPESSQMGHPSRDMQQHRDMDQQRDMEHSKDQHMETLREQKMEQEQKELGKGSTQGQTSREEHRKKWWKFWE